VYFLEKLKSEERIDSIPKTASRRGCSASRRFIT
jgi:hypothetical protein